MSRSCVWMVFYRESDGYETWRDVIARDGEEALAVAQEMIRDETTDYFPEGAVVIGVHYSENMNRREIA